MDFLTIGLVCFLNIVSPETIVISNFRELTLFPKNFSHVKFMFQTRAKNSAVSTFVFIRIDCFQCDNYTQINNAKSIIATWGRLKKFNFLSKICVQPRVGHFLGKINKIKIRGWYMCKNKFNGK